MKLKNIIIVLLAVGLSLLSFISHAETGWCKPVNGVNVFSYDFGNKVITDPNQNKAGQTYSDLYTWDLGKTYPVKCDCPTGKYHGEWFLTRTNLPMDHVSEGKTYFKVNDYLAVSTAIYVAAAVANYVETPFDNNGKGVTNGAGGDACATTNFGTGSKGHLSLYISKSFVGESVIPSTKVLDMYVSAIAGSFGSEPVVSLYISGALIVPQNCVINAGTTLDVDFAGIAVGDFKEKGQMPVGFTPKTVHVPIKCNDISATANLTLRLQATPDPSDSTVIQSSNKDVGVAVTNESGNRLVPNDTSSVIPFNLDSNLSADVKLRAFPISSSGQTPEAGVFQSQAYLRVDFN